MHTNEDDDYFLQLSAMDVLVLKTMKNAVKCDT
jgi:hypothetical protein